MVTVEIKQRIVEGVKEAITRMGTAKAVANKVNVNAAQISRILSGDLAPVSDGLWMQMARLLDLQLNDEEKWVTVETAGYQYLYGQLTGCKKLSVSNLLVDMTGIGKSYNAKVITKQLKNAVYVDCSQCKSKQKLIRAISREFGLGDKGKYSELYDTLIYTLKTIEKPLIVLDEAGDLDYSAFLELKALWNATENFCGWYMMGADGLRAKVERCIANKKVGYAEIFDRYNSDFKFIVPQGKEEREEFLNNQVAMVAKANGVTNIQSFVKLCGGSLRKAYKEVMKIRELARMKNEE